MKKCFLVVFNLKNPHLNQEKVLLAIKAESYWAKINDSSFIMYSSNDVTFIRDSLVKLLYQGDNLFVVELSASAAWAGMSEEFSTWVRNNLK